VRPVGATRAKTPKKRQHDGGGAGHLRRERSAARRSMETERAENPPPATGAGSFSRRAPPSGGKAFDAIALYSSCPISIPNATHFSPSIQAEAS
jgi:hypothetical protein